MNLILKTHKFSPKLEIFTKSIGIRVFGHENKKIYSISVLTKCFEEKHVDLLLLREEGKGHYVYIKDFNTFMYDQILNRGRKYLHCYFFTSFLVQDKY